MADGKGFNGRPRKSTATKKAQGTYQKCRDKVKNEARIKENDKKSVLEPGNNSPILGDFGNKVYKETAELLLDSKIMTKADTALVRQFAELCEIKNQAWYVMTHNPDSMEKQTVADYFFQNPTAKTQAAYKAFMSASSQLITVANQLGLSPVSRQHISAPQDEMEDPMMILFRKKAEERKKSG